MFAAVDVAVMGSLQKFASTRAAFARPGPRATRSPASPLLCGPPTPISPSALAAVPLAFGLPRGGLFFLAEARVRPLTPASLGD